MEIIIVKPHSTIDVITNSSSELFICKTNKTVKQVKEILEELLKLYNKMSGAEYTFEQCFGGVYQLENKSEVLDYLMEISIYEVGLDFSGYQHKTTYEEKAKMQERKENDWINKEYNNNLDKYLNSVIIKSAFDNSIPYELFDLIEIGFNAKRYHLG